ncbi:STAS domain-containing protein [Thermoactinospora rubra]|uniref:STAS domain-containing protein n=1 Tax=Thermoactinospora rubra TaxID=1088767 RepID=UPI000A10585C|nr:STAS domain-containing protein [Thermoactinospora rubra]
MPGDRQAAREAVMRAIAGNRGRIASTWVDTQLARATPAIGGEELGEEVQAIISCLLEGLGRDLPDDRVATGHAPLREAVADLSRRWARLGASPTAIATAVFSLKPAILGCMAPQAEEALLVGRLIDAAALVSFQTYVDSREEIIQRQNRQLLEISTPVVHLWHRVLAVPLIGTLDSARAQIVMESLLQAIQDHQAAVAIIDITGVPTVDTVVAQHLMQTVTATRLMGADCVLSGISPRIAQMVAQLGIDLSEITTRSSLADALTEAMRLVQEEGRTERTPAG